MKNEELEWCDVLGLLIIALLLCCALYLEFVHIHGEGKEKDLKMCLENTPQNYEFVDSRRQCIHNNCAMFKILSNRLYCYYETLSNCEYDECSIEIRAEETLNHGELTFVTNNCNETIMCN